MLSAQFWKYFPNPASSHGLYYHSSHSELPNLLPRLLQSVPNHFPASTCHWILLHTPPLLHSKPQGSFWNSSQLPPVAFHLDQSKIQSLYHGLKDLISSHSSLLLISWNSKRLFALSRCTKYSPVSRSLNWVFFAEIAFLCTDMWFNPSLPLGVCSDITFAVHPVYLLDPPRSFSFHCFIIPYITYHHLVHYLLICLLAFSLPRGV